jgi:two-component system chemotaxis response regulator CheY
MHCLDEVIGMIALQKLNAAAMTPLPFSLMLCDWNMPNLDGLGVVKACRADPLFQNLPIIMVSAESERLAVIKALEEGATDYIIKPFSTDMLERKLKWLLVRID